MLHKKYENSRSSCPQSLFLSQSSSPDKGRLGGVIAFTLVELIVVVTILAILATIGFVSYSSYLIGVRDTNRIAQMTKMSDGLNLYSTRNALPIPEDYVEVQINGSLIGYQGYAGSSVLETIEYEKGGVDPKDNTYFTYYLTKDRKYFQLLGFLEEGSDLTGYTPSSMERQGELSLVNRVYANSYSERIPTVLGKKLGVLTDDLNTPIQEISAITSVGLLDISSSTTGYKGYYGDKEIYENAELLMMNPLQSCKRLKQLKGAVKSGRYTINPDGTGEKKVFCDMTLDGGGWTLVGISNGNYPSADFLDGETGVSPKSLKPGYEYSTDASDIFFSEVAMGLDGDTQKYFGFSVPDGFINERAFEATAGSPQTCTLIEGYYSKDNGAKKYWREHYGFAQSLITNRRFSQGGVDLGNSSDCESSGNSLAVYRNSTTHSISAGNGASSSPSWNNLGSLTRTPSATELSASDYPAAGVDRNVWIMVR